MQAIRWRLWMVTMQMRVLETGWVTVAVSVVGGRMREFGKPTAYGPITNVVISTAARTSHGSRGVCLAVNGRLPAPAPPVQQNAEQH